MAGEKFLKAMSETARRLAKRWARASKQGSGGDGARAEAAPTEPAAPKTLEEAAERLVALAKKAFSEEAGSGAATGFQAPGVQLSEALDLWAGQARRASWEASWRLGRLREEGKAELADALETEALRRFEDFDSPGGAGWSDAERLGLFGWAGSRWAQEKPGDEAFIRFAETASAFNGRYDAGSSRGQQVAAWAAAMKMLSHAAWLGSSELKAELFPWEADAGSEERERLLAARAAAVADPGRVTTSDEWGKEAPPSLFDCVEHLGVAAVEAAQVGGSATALTSLSIFARLWRIDRSDGRPWRLGHWAPDRGEKGARAVEAAKAAGVPGWAADPAEPVPVWRWLQEPLPERLDEGPEGQWGLGGEVLRKTAVKIWKETSARILSEGYSASFSDDPSAREWERERCAKAERSTLAALALVDAVRRRSSDCPQDWRTERADLSSVSDGPILFDAEPSKILALGGLSELSGREFDGPERNEALLAAAEEAELGVEGARAVRSRRAAL